MENLILYTGAGASLIIGIQDFLTRRIHIFLLVILGGAGILLNLSANGIDGMSMLGINFILTTVIWGVLILVSHIRKKRPIQDQMLGWGDILMLYASGCWLSFMGLLQFYSFSTILLSLIIAVLILARIRDRNVSIPLAGFWGVCLFLIILHDLFPQINNLKWTVY